MTSRGDLAGAFNRDVMPEPRDQNRPANPGDGEVLAIGGDHVAVDYVAGKLQQIPSSDAPGGSSQEQPERDRRLDPYLRAGVTLWPHRLELSLASASVLVTCRYETCRDETADYFSVDVRPEAEEDTHKGLALDAIVGVERPHTSRELFRARSDGPTGPALEGVKVFYTGSKQDGAWTSALPPIPPFAVPAYRDRLVGLHAAALSRQGSGVVVIAGRRGAGKSSIALELASRGWTFFTDETCLIERRTRMAHPFPQAIGARSGKGKEPVRASRLVPSIASAPRAVSALVFLHPVERAREPTLRQLPRPSTRFGLLMQHHLDAGCELREGVVTLADMANSTPGWLLELAPASRQAIAHGADLITAATDIM